MHQPILRNLSSFQHRLVFIRSRFPAPLRTFSWLLIACCALLFIACVPVQLPNLQINQSAQTSQRIEAQSSAPSLDGVLASVDDYTIPTPEDTFVMPTPTPTPASDNRTFVVVAITDSRINIRAEARQDSPIVGKGNPGDVFEVIGRSADGDWLQLCCVAGDDQTSGWASASLLRPATDQEAADAAEGDRTTSSTSTEASATVKPRLQRDLQAQWQVDWSCGSDRCTVKDCTAQVDAKSKETADQSFLSIEHSVTWDQTCFSTDNWVFEVDPYTGKERTGEYEKNFLYGYWQGTQSDDPSGVFPLNSQQGVLVSCTGPVGVEIPEGGGWTSVYEGTICHDMNTGMMIYMKYLKRWLFTGEFDGQKYERAFFGDTETLEQQLVSTNVALAYAQKK